MTAHSEETRRRVLVIDDNSAIHEDIRKVLGLQPGDCAELLASEAAVFGAAETIESGGAVGAEYQIDSAYQGEDGIAMAGRARSIGQPYAIAIVDARMPPGLDGIETIARLWEVDPDILVILCTAYSDYSWWQIRRRLPRPERLIILKKPFDNIEVQQLAASLAEKWRLCRVERERLALLEGMITARNSDAHSAGRGDAQRRCGSGSQPEAAANRRTLIERALGDAFEEGRLFLHYQPLVDITTRCVVGLEALLRWRHAELGPISPGEFIPIAEQTGLIVPIGEFVLRSVCAQLVRWERAQVPVVPVAINVSAVQLKSHGVWERMRQILHEEGVQPKHLALELTESTLMENASRHGADLQSLRADGVGIEIDDFGTGYSSLSCLKQLPLDTLKIDRSFVTHLETSKTDRTIVGAILAMTRSLGLRVVAEGVETVGQLQVLGQHGCEIAQGYYFSPPIAAEECGELLVDLASRDSFTETLRLRTRSSARVLPAQLSAKGAKR